jgi:hypothetical protein
VVDRAIAVGIDLRADPPVVHVVPVRDDLRRVGLVVGLLAAGVFGHLHQPVAGIPRVDRDLAGLDIRPPRPVAVAVELIIEIAVAGDPVLRPRGARWAVSQNPLVTSSPRRRGRRLGHPAACMVVSLDCRDSNVEYANLQRKTPPNQSDCRLCT